MEGEWSCYRGGHFNGGGNGHVTEVVNFMKGEWSCCRGGNLNGWGNGHVTEVACLIDGECSCYGEAMYGHVIGGIIMCK